MRIGNSRFCIIPVLQTAGNSSEPSCRKRARRSYVNGKHKLRQTVAKAVVPKAKACLRSSALQNGYESKHCQIDVSFAEGMHHQNQVDEASCQEGSKLDARLYLLMLRDVQSRAPPATFSREDMLNSTPSVWGWNLPGTFVISVAVKTHSIGPAGGAYR